MGTCRYLSGPERNPSVRGYNFCFGSGDRVVRDGSTGWDHYGSGEYTEPPSKKAGGLSPRSIHGEITALWRNFNKIEDKVDHIHITCYIKKKPSGGILMTLQHTIKAVIHKGETHYVAECVEAAIVTQGTTLDETINNLKEAVELHLEGENLAELGLAPNPTLIVTMEVEPVYA